MIITGIDPGNKESGYCTFDFSSGKKISSGICLNEILLETINETVESEGVALVAIERVSCMGMAVGEEVFETVFFTGRLFQTIIVPVVRIKRTEVKMHICGTMRAKDANIRQALIDRFGVQGTKKNPGALYGISSHAWPALAVATVAYDQFKFKGHL